MDFAMLKGRLQVSDVKTLNPLALAFVGDAVYETFIRAYLVQGNTELSAHKLHLQAISFVKAHAQSDIMKKIMPMLIEEEINIYKRGRNTKSPSVPKNADVQEYRTATGFETLIGYLYLTEQEERLNEVLSAIITKTNKKD